MLLFVILLIFCVIILYYVYCIVHFVFSKCLYIFFSFFILVSFMFYKIFLIFLCIIIFGSFINLFIVMHMLSVNDTDNIIETGIVNTDEFVLSDDIDKEVLVDSDISSLRDNIQDARDNINDLVLVTDCSKLCSGDSEIPKIRKEFYNICNDVYYNTGRAGLKDFMLSCV